MQEPNPKLRKMRQHRERVGLLMVNTGNGKGKSTASFGMAVRAVGHGMQVHIVQFIKGEQLSGEELFAREHLPDSDFYQMGTGFTWDTQNRQSDIEAAERTWAEAARMLQDPAYDLVVLDEITYMLSFDYLDEAQVIKTVQARPEHQSVVLTGRHRLRS